MEWFFNKIVSIYSILLMILTVGIGFFTLLWDTKYLISHNHLKEAKWAKILGYIYIFAGGGIYIAIKILS
ncbi:MAG TPA: hypothetical protein PKK61_01560 [Defluviitaleaceae bacterium]|nr:hypothetical protein [Candidatus Epulonipiscium sp.]HOA79738.1 hypothetical protein [Defluviitaleaceae bacterium]